MIVNDNMIATETSVTAGQGQPWLFRLFAQSVVRTERPRACSDFDVVHGLREKTMSIGDGAGQSAWRARQTFPKASMALRPPKNDLAGML